MNKEITIRPAQAEDAEIIFQYICALEEDLVADPELFRHYYLENIAHPNNIYLVAVNSAELVMGYISCHGQLLLHHMGMVYEIQEMYVEEESRSKGIGNLLVKTLETILNERDFKSFEVTANKKRVESIIFYENCGFVQSHSKLTKQNQQSGN